MYQQIGDEENRILLIFTDIQFYRGAVLLHHYSVNGKRNSNPLIFFYAAVIVSVQIGKSSLLIERILLNIQSGAVNMCSQNINAFRHWLFTDAEHNNGLIHPYTVYFIAFNKFLTILNKHFQLTVAFFFNGIYNGVNTLSFRLAVIQKIPVFQIQIFQLL